jgi:hypothetical protein
MAKMDEIRQIGGREQKRSECRLSGLAVLLLPVGFRPPLLTRSPMKCRPRITLPKCRTGGQR